MFGPFWALLKGNGPYRLIWLAYFVSILGDWFSYVANISAVVGLSNNSGVALSIYLVLRRFPPFLLGPFVGVAADAFDRTTIMIWSDVARVVVMGAMAAFSSRLWILYLLVTLQSSFSALFDPARSAILPQVVGRDQVSTATVLDQTTRMTLLCVGTALGGLVTNSLGIRVVYLLNAGTYIASLLLLIRFKPQFAALTQARAATLASRSAQLTNERPDDDAVDAEPSDRAQLLEGDGSVQRSEGGVEMTSMDQVIGKEALDGDVVVVKPASSRWKGVRMFMEGLTYLNQHRFMLAVSLVKFSAAIDGGSNLANIRFSEGDFRLPNDRTGSMTLGVMYACIGLGTAGGPLIAKRYTADTSRAQTDLIIFSFFLAAASCALMASMVYWPTMVGFLLLNVTRGAGWSIGNTFSTAILQRVVATSYVGRVMAFDTGIFTLNYTIVIIIAGLMFDNLHITPYTFFAITAVTYFIDFLVWLAYFRGCGRKSVQDTNTADDDS